MLIINHNNFFNLTCLITKNSSYGAWGLFKSPCHWRNASPEEWIPQAAPYYTSIFNISLPFPDLDPSPDPNQYLSAQYIRAVASFCRHGLNYNRAYYLYYPLCLLFAVSVGHHCWEIANYFDCPQHSYRGVN